jgi:hypothetical protein
MTEWEAGLDLDAAIARRVFGAPERTPNAWGYLEHGRQHVTKRPRPLYPPYSTDMAAAWRVVEHFAADGWNISLGKGHGTAEWFANLYHPDDHPNDYEADADTMPLAICRAALAALGHAEGQDG